jgi:threonine dehydrogenase-like Zn-dependent dehydrogenase
MKAICVLPGRAGSIHLRDIPKPDLTDIPGGRGVLVRVVAVGVDGTDKEINAALYGAAPPGDDYLVLGHESLGVVEAVGPNVTTLKPGDHVVATVRRKGTSLFDAIGTYDMTTDDTYLERGINLRHGYLTEYYVDDPEYLVLVPPGLASVGMLLEPCSVIEKGIAQAYETQRRLRVWKPVRAAVLGAGTIGLLAAMALRLRGLEVTVLGRTPRPYLNSDLAEAIGARYLTTADIPVVEAARAHGPFDLIFEASGHAPLAFEAMEALGRNGILVLSGVSGGDAVAEVPVARVNLGFVLGNKAMIGTVNANREYFETGIRDMAQAEATWPGWLARFLTHPVSGLENYRELMDTLTSAQGAIKVFCRVAA